MSHRKMMLNAKEARECSSKTSISKQIFDMILECIAGEKFTLTIEKKYITNKEIMALRNLGYWITEADEFNINIAW